MNKPDFSKAEIRLCILRSLCVSVFVMLSLFIVHIFDNNIWLTSLAASSFIAFAFPKADSVRTKVLIGGYLSACVFGALAGVILSTFSPNEVTVIIFAGAALFFATLCMTILDYEHPPAAALVLALVVTDKPILVAIFSLCFIILLSIVKMPLAKLILKTNSTSKDE